MRVVKSFAKQAGFLLAALGFAGLWGCSTHQNTAPPMPKRAPVVSQDASMPNIENFDPAKYKGKTGKIAIPSKGASFIALRKMKDPKRWDMLEARAKNGEFILPVGKYRLLSYSARIKDKNNVNWSISSNKSTDILVKSGLVQKISLAEPPFVVSTKAEQMNSNQINIDLSIIGRGGDECSIQCSDSHVKPPRFQILSKSGQVLQEGSFQYG